MKIKFLGSALLLMLLAGSAYAQDVTTMSRRELRKQERAERKARVNQNLKAAGRDIGDAATEIGRGAKETAKDAGEAIDRGVDKAGTAIEREADKIKARRGDAKRDSVRAAKRDTLKR